VAVLAMLLRMDLGPYVAEAQAGKSTLSTLREGVRYALDTRPIRNLLLLLGFAAGIGFQYMVLLPVYAREILHADARAYGFMVSAFGLGSLVSALTMTRRQDRQGLRRNLLIGLGTAGVGMGVFAWSRLLPLTLAMGFLAGFGLILYVASTNTLLQLTTEDRLRGRIMSLYTLMFIGTAPIGSLLCGSIAQQLGAPVATSVSALALLLGALWVSYRLRVIAAREAGRAAVPVFTEKVD
jgi:MFS family permease